MNDIFLIKFSGDFLLHSVWAKTKEDCRDTRFLVVNYMTRLFRGAIQGGKKQSSFVCLRYLSLGSNGKLNGCEIREAPR